MYNSSDLRKGLKVEIDGQPWQIVEFDFCKPGKGLALYRTKLKNMITGNTMERTFRPNDRHAKPQLEERDQTYLYSAGEEYVFSDNSTFEETYISGDLLGDQVHFLVENAACKILYYNDLPLEVTLPIFIDKTIQYTEPGAKGDTATNTLKPAALDSGYEVQVPLWINEGDVIKIDTRTGEYSERVRKG